MWDLTDTSSQWESNRIFMNCCGWDNWKYHASALGCPRFLFSFLLSHITAPNVVDASGSTVDIGGFGVTPNGYVSVVEQYIGSHEEPTVFMSGSTSHFVALGVYRHRRAERNYSIPDWFCYNRRICPATQSAGILAVSSIFKTKRIPPFTDRRIS